MSITNRPTLLLFVLPVCWLWCGSLSAVCAGSVEAEAYLQIVRLNAQQQYGQALAAGLVLVSQTQAYPLKLFEHLTHAARQAGKLEETKQELEKLLARQAGDVRLIYGIALLQQELGNPELAIESLKRCIEQLPQAAAPLLKLVHIYHLQGQAPVAEAFLTTTLQLHPANAAVYLAQGVLAALRKDSAAAVAATAQARTLAPQMTEACHHQVRILYQADWLKEAVTSANQCLPEIRDAHETEARKDLFFWRGLSQARLGMPEAALADFQAARAISLNLHDRQGELNYLFYIGSSAWAQDLYGEALIAYQQALRLARQLGNRVSEGLLLANLGSVCQTVGDFASAGQYLQTAQQIFAALTGNEQHQANIWARIGGLHAIQKNFPAAIQAYQQALHYGAQSKSPIGQAAYYNALADLYLRTGDKTQSGSLIEQALVHANKQMDLEVKLDALSLAGEWRLRTGELPHATALYQELIHLATQGHRPHHLWNAYSGLALVAHRQGRLSEAEKLYRQAVDLIEGARSGLGREVNRIGFLHDKLQTFGGYIAVLMALHHRQPTAGFDREAFHLNERARARALLESVSEASWRLNAGLEPSLLARRREIQAQVSLAERRLNQIYQSNAAAAEERQAAEEALRKAVNDLRGWQVEVRNQAPHQAELPSPQPLTVEQVQQLFKQP